MTRMSRPLFFASAIAVGLTLLFWLPLWKGGGLIGGDLYTYYFPQKIVYAEQISQGVVPLWHPLTGHGYPLLAESQTGVFYPFNMLFYSTLSINTAYNCNHILHYILTFLFTWMFARRLKLSNGAAMLTALIFTYGWFPVRSCLEWAIVTGAWLPLALWAVESFLQLRRWRYLIGLSLILGIQLLAGHFNIAFLTHIILVIYVPLRLWFANEGLPAATTAVRKSILLVTVAAIVCGFLLASVQLLPTWELKKNSQRAETGKTFNPAYGHIPIWYWTQNVSALLWYRLDVDKALSTEKKWTVNAGTNRVEAHLYLGMIPFWLVFGAVGLAILKRCSLTRQQWMWVLIAVSTLVYTSGWLLIATRYLPGFSFFQGPGRWGLLTTLAVAILAGSIIDNLLKSDSPKIFHWQKILCCFIFIFTAVEFWQVNQWMTYTKMVIDSPVVYRSESGVMQTLTQYQRRNGMPRLFSPGANVANLTGFAATPTYLGLSPREYYDKNLTIPDSPKAAKDDPLRHTTPEQILWLQKAGVTHILSFKPLDPEQWPANISWQGEETLLNGAWSRYNEPIYLYELHGARGRISFADDAENKSAVIQQYGVHEIVASVDSESGGKVILTDLAYPGWTVTVDGEPAESLVVDGMYRAVEVSAGEHTLTWKFESSSFRWGALLSLLTFIGLAAFAHICFWHPQRVNLFTDESA